MEKPDMKFEEWLERTWQHAPLVVRVNMVSAAAVLFFSGMLIFISPPLGAPMFVLLGALMYWAFRQAWKRDLADPPWYLKGENGGNRYDEGDRAENGSKSLDGS